MGHPGEVQGRNGLVVTIAPPASPLGVGNGGNRRQGLFVGVALRPHGVQGGTVLGAGHAGGGLAAPLAGHVAVAEQHDGGEVLFVVTVRAPGLGGDVLVAHTSSSRSRVLQGLRCPSCMHSPASSGTCRSQMRRILAMSCTHPRPLSPTLFL